MNVPLAELEASWFALADADAAKAYRAIENLVSASDQAVPFLTERLRPAEPAIVAT